MRNAAAVRLLSGFGLLGVGGMLGATPGATVETTTESSLRSLLSADDLSGWRFGGNHLAGQSTANGGKWRLKGGVLTAAEGAGMVTLARAFEKDFQLELEYRADAAAEGGVILRGPRFALRPSARGSKSWNRISIRVHNAAPTVRVNGQLVPAQRVKARLNGPAPAVLLDGNPVQGPIEMLVAPTAEIRVNEQTVEKAFRLPLRGPVGLQGHRGQLEFRNLRWRAL